MAEPEDFFQYDPRWPPNDVKRTFNAFTRKEDDLILDYLIRTKQFEHLSGHEVWKGLARSKKFNPAGRTFQGLRERFVRHILKRLQSYNVSPIYRARFLKTNLKALENVNSMKSTKELQQDFQTPWSHESEEDSVEENEPRSSRMTPVLKERERLLREMNGDKITTSTPVERVADQTPVVVQNTGALVSAEPLHDTSEVFSSISTENSSIQSPSRESQCMQRALAVYTGPPSAHFHFNDVISFVFKDPESPHLYPDVSFTVRLLQNSLQKTLLGHKDHLLRRSFSCGESTCVGTRVYFELWTDLKSYLSKIKAHQSRYEAFYLKCFKRVIREILETPTCTETQVENIPDYGVEDLFEYLSCEVSKPLKKKIEEVQKLMRCVKKDP